MMANEKKLILLAGILLLLVLLVRVVPMMLAYYQAGQEEIALLHERVERYQQLVTDTGQWQEREVLKRAETAEYESWIFEGNDPRLVGTSVQRTLRQAVEQSGINVREMSVARYSYVDDWLMVTQDMNVILDQANILPFLKALSAQKPKLFVTGFSVVRSRRQYTGTISVVGFGRAVSAQPALAKAERAQ